MAICQRRSKSDPLGGQFVVSPDTMVCLGVAMRCLGALHEGVPRSAHAPPSKSRRTSEQLVRTPALYWAPERRGRWTKGAGLRIRYQRADLGAFQDRARGDIIGLAFVRECREAENC